MSRHPASVPVDLSVQSLIDDYLFRYFDVFPVVVGTQVVGCVSVRQVATLPRRMVLQNGSGYHDGCSPNNTVQADSDALKALAQMNKTESSRLLVPMEIG